MWSLLSWASEGRQLPIDGGHSLTAGNCVEASQKIEHSLKALTSRDYLNLFSENNFDALSDELWGLKLSLHHKMRSLYSQNAYSVDCARALRGAFHAIRQSEDIVEESSLRRGASGSTPSSAFELGNRHVHRSSEFSDFNLQTDLKSGDILLTRGNAFTSAAIASLGEEDTQFSHMSLVYRDENEKIWTIEAHIEVGSFVRPLEDHIKDSNFRTMILRFDDPQIAAKAAAFAFRTVKHASETKGNIPYDFGFDMEESENLFCSEVVSWSFQKVSEGKVQIPLIRNRVQLRKSSFVHDLGISAQESFIPADIEVDPRFKVVAEWRDANRINDSMEKDAVLQGMYAWVDDHHYRMINASSRKSKFYRNIVWVMRRTPLLKTYVDKKLPLNMSRKLIGYFGVLESIGELLQKVLKEADEQAMADRSLPLLPLEKFKVLEEFRLKDLKQKRPELHRMFRTEGAPIQNQNNKESEEPFSPSPRPNSRNLI
jgi:hypothetical protein